MTGVAFLPSTRRDDIDFWPFWCFLITGPVLFINLIIYLVTGRRISGIIDPLPLLRHYDVWGVIVGNN